MPVALTSRAVAAPIFFTRAGSLKETNFISEFRQKIIDIIIILFSEIDMRRNYFFNNKKYINLIHHF